MDPIVAILNYVGQIIAQMVGTIQLGIQSAVNSVGNALGSVATGIGQSLSHLLDGIVPTITGIVAGVVQKIGSFFDPLFQTLFDMVSRIDATIRGFLEPLINVVNQIIQRVQSVFTELLSTARELVSDILGRIARLVEDTYEGIRAFVADVASRIASTFQQVVATVRSWIESVFSTVVGFIRQGFALAEDLWNRTKAAIANGIDALVKLVTTTLSKTADLITAEWKKLVTGAESIIESVNERIQGLATSFDTAAERLGTALTSITEEQLKPLVESVTNYAKLFVDVLSPQAYASLEEAVAQAVAPGTLNLRGSEGFSRFFASMLPKSPAARIVFVVSFGIALTWGVYRGVVDANAEVLLQEYGKNHPFRVLAPADVIPAYRRGNASQEKVLESIRAGGFTAEDAVLMIKNSENVPPPGDLIAFWLRGLIGDQTLNEALNVQGYRDEWAQRIKDASMIIPPVQDLITMAVREVFSPAVASRFGQFQDFPEAFGQWSEQLGLSTEWAERYWAAHWALPSATQGFEMVHREAIQESDLDLLLKALDVMPFWREPLKKITYNVLTRVDIRRMHQLGVLSEEDVRRAHRHLGYDERNAGLLTEFVLKLNKGKTAEDETELGKLTRASILGFYSDGLLTRQRAHELLVALNITPEAAELYLASEDLSSHRSERKAEAEHIVELAKVGSLTFQQANDRLNQLGLETLEVERALTKLIRAQEQKTKLPSQDDGEKFYVQGIVSKDDYQDLLERLGYNLKWVTAYVALAERKKESAQTKG
jgi:hypothetical protein